MAMCAVPGESEPWKDIEYLFGKYLLEQQHPVLAEFIEKEWRLYEKIQTQLTETNQTETARYQEVKAYLCALEQAKTYNQQTL